MEKWERQAGESYPAFEAFNAYLTLPERSYPKVASKVKKSISLIKRWAKDNKWRERADAWDAEISRKAMEKSAEDYAAMVDRQIQIGRLLQGKAANAIQQIDFNNLPPKFLPSLTEMIKAGVNIERSARELKKAKPQENILIETLEKICRKEEQDDD